MTTTAQEHYGEFRDKEHCREEAAKVGCEPIFADDTTLLLDLDGAAELSYFRDQYQRAVSNEVLPKDCAVEEWRSKSKGWHVHITMPEPLPVMERLALQSMLGSDRVRDLLSLARVRKGVNNPILLFRPTAAPVPVPDLDDETLPF